MKILDKNDAGWLIQQDDGSIKPMGNSKENRAMMDHGLYGIFNDGDEWLVIQSEEHPQVTIIPEEGGREFTLNIGDYDPLHIGVHQKSRLVEAVVDGFEADVEDNQAEAARLVIDLYDDIRENMVRIEITDALAGRPPFNAHVEKHADGWLIHDHLLLTWNRKFHHPDTTTWRRSGSTVSRASTEEAYSLSMDSVSDMEPEVTLNGKKYRLTAAEMDFIARGLWASANAPKRVPTV
jgi:hypothetical protein